MDIIGDIDIWISYPQVGGGSSPEETVLVCPRGFDRFQQAGDFFLSCRDFDPVVIINSSPGCSSLSHG